MRRALREALPGYTVEPITPQTVDRVAEVYASNRAYFMLTEGAPASREDCLRDIEAVPAGRDISDKVFVSLADEQGVVAVLDLLAGYPRTDGVWIGLLLVDQGRHRQGIGRAVTEGVAAAARRKGYAVLQLGVVAENKRGLAFWGRQGFTEVRRKVVAREGKPDWNVVVMERAV